jgi:hypothetical protein
MLIRGMVRRAERWELPLIHDTTKNVGVHRPAFVATFHFSWL